MTRFVALIFAACAGASPAVASAETLAASGHGVAVRITYRLHPAQRVSAEITDAAYVTSGSIAVVTNHTSLTVPLRALDVGTPPFIQQNFPASAANGCGAARPIDFEPLAGSRYPVVAIATIVVTKGCTPFERVFVPIDGTSVPYEFAYSFTLVKHPGALPAHAGSTLTIRRLRIVTIPKPPNVAFVANWMLAIVDGIDESGRALTIVLDRPNPADLPKAGDRLRFYDVKSSFRLPIVTKVGR